MLCVYPASDCLVNWDADVAQLPLSKDFASRPSAVTVGLQDDSMCLLTGGYSQEEIKHWCVKRNIGLDFLNIHSLNHRLELPCSSSRATRSENSHANVCMLGPNIAQVRTSLFTAACHLMGKHILPETPLWESLYSIHFVNMQAIISKVSQTRYWRWALSPLPR